MRINHARVDERRERFPIDKRGQPRINLLISFCQHFSNNVVAASGHPERPRFTFVAEIVDHRPRIEDIRLAEAVAIVPLADFVVLVGGTVICRHLFDFVSGKAKIGAVLVIQHGIDGQIVHPAEDTLLGHAQNACEEAKGQMLVVLEAAGKQVA